MLIESPRVGVVEHIVVEDDVDIVVVEELLGDDELPATVTGGEGGTGCALKAAEHLHTQEET